MLLNSPSAKENYIGTGSNKEKPMVIMGFSFLLKQSYKL
ncbi:hypothetical protein FTV88_3078 [Heliorestis convoluta]|uniref:Uncharacterized protein n=1 Tax=Heliorestis convoluta TaxID=356322 RepID=A0A5Q2N5D6_9FIRM|nr:hypothetical protein FTV88_3078 [Heliorestis convoluta]